MKKKPFVLYPDEIQALKDLVSINNEQPDEERSDNNEHRA